MATAISPYSSTEETTNANRACRLLLGPCTDQLRDVLRKKVPPNTFAAEIIKQKYNLPRLNPEQRDLILPHNGSYTGNYDDFDISLLYILLRNLCYITPHTNGWGNVPDVNDTCLSANIENIRIARNNTVHSVRHSLTNNELNDIWTSVRVAVVAMDTFLSNGNFYEKEVDNLRYTTMDPVQDKHYRDELAKQYEDDQDTKECIHTLEENIGSYQRETAGRIGLLEETQKALKDGLHIASLQQKQFQNDLKEDLQKHLSTCIPGNIRDQHKRTLESWKKGVFFETSSYKDMKDFFLSHQIVVVIGSPGSGKTALIRHIALQLESKYQIVPIAKPEDIFNFGDYNTPQIFVIDDAFGVFTLERNLLSDFERQSKQIENVLDKQSKRSKLFMSCRLAVYNEAKELDVEFFEANNILNLNNEENSLTLEDQKGIFESHMMNEGISCVLDLTVLHEKGNFMFPLLCQMFSSDKCIRDYRTDFFKSPYKCLLSEIGKIKRRNNLQYSSMVLCMLNNNCLSEGMLIDSKIINLVCSSCKVERYPQNWEIIQQLSHLKGTYITENDEKYSFVHDSIFEAVAFQYG